MTAQLKLNQAANEIKTLKKQIADFNGKYARSLENLNIAKIDLNDTWKVRSKLSALKTEAESLAKILNAMISGGIRQYAKTHQERQDGFTHGRFGNLKGEVTPIIAGLNVMIAHLATLIDSSGESKREAVTTTALVKAAEKLMGHDKYGPENILAEGLGAIMAMVAIIQMIKAKIR